MPDFSRDLENAIWAVADSRATAADLAVFHADPKASRVIIDRLITDADEDLAAASSIRGDERHQIVADLEDQLDGLHDAYDLLIAPLADVSVDGDDTPLGEARLQASWQSGMLVVWAAGPRSAPEDNDALADRLEAIGGPSVGWKVHPTVPLPGGLKADALAIPIRDALGWLVAVSAGLGRTGIGHSVEWLSRVALEGVRLVARGAIVPAIDLDLANEGRFTEASVRWKPALLDEALITQLAAAMPGPITVIEAATGRQATMAVLNAVVDAIVTTAAGRLELPAPPPSANNPNDVAETLIARLNGSTFRAPTGVTGDIARRLDQWARTATRNDRPRIVIQLLPPDSGGAWLLSALAPAAKGRLAPVDEVLRDGKATRALVDEMARLERAFPLLRRSVGKDRGKVILSQAEAWELMTVTGPLLESLGFGVRAPALSRRKPTPALRLFAEIGGDSVVGANQLSNVRWSVLFDDVELTAAEIARLANQARPLVQSRGRWVELDRVDLKEAAAALEERASITEMTGAEILRHGIGLDGGALAGGVIVHGSGWATDLLRRAEEVSREPVSQPRGFVGELRNYQAQALGWLGFLDAAELGGCLALDMGLGKTPTVLAHVARTAGNGAALVVAPPAVVGNWAAEAARFTPGLKVLVHHGADRYEAAALTEEIRRADLVITTYGTAVRDIDELSAVTWTRVVLDEAQAIKNSSSETAHQLRRLNAPSRVALTGTPVENGLGDLWSILDFTNPGLVGSRATFVAQMSGEGEAALRALNGLLVFRRTKSEPEVAAELPDKIDELDHCTMTPEQIGLYQAVLNGLVTSMGESSLEGAEPKQGAILAAITALKQICNHPVAYHDDGGPLTGRSGKLSRLEEIIESVFAAGEKILIFTHFATWGRRLATHLSAVTGQRIACYDGSLARGARDRLIDEFQRQPGAGALVLSLKAGGTGLNLTAASHVVLYDRWWNPAVEDQARDRAWRIGQTRTVVSHRLVCPGTVDERVEEVVAGKRHIAELVLPKSSSLSDLSTDQLRIALGLGADVLLTEEAS